MYEFQKTKKRVIYWYQWKEWPGFYCTLKGWFKSSGWDRWKSLGLHCNSLSSSCSWYGASSVSMEKGEKARQYVLFDSCKIQKLFIKLQSKGCHDCRIPFCLCTLNIIWKNCPLPHTVLENVLRLKPFMTSLFGKVAAWLWKLWCVPTTGSPLSFLWRSKLCTLWCCVISSKKANLSDVWQSVRAVKFPSSEKKGKEKKSFSVDPRLSHLTTLWSIPSSYSAWMSSRICGNWGWYRALEQLKLMVFTPRFIT